jgi:hypothetical protein
MLLAGRLLGISVVAYVLHVFFGKRPDSNRAALRFNEALVASGVPVFTAGREFASAAHAVLEGRVDDKRELENAFEAVEVALLQARRTSASLIIPDSAAARAFVRAFHHLLYAQERIVRDDYAVILAILRDAAQPAALRYNRVSRIAHTIARVDVEALAEVQRTQQAFAAEYRFSIG